LPISVLTPGLKTGKTLPLFFRNIREDKVRIEQVHIGPITTPDCPDPTEIPRYIRDDDGYYGFDTVFVEDVTWKVLCDIAREQDCTVDDLCLTISNEFPAAADFTQAARYYVLRTLAKKISGTIHYGGEKQARKSLCISGKEWSDFGNLLNNHDFRHAELTGKAPPVSPVAIDDAYATARRWVVAYLKTKGLTIF
jgi:predicted DNA-binding ribbon-helix-helix protein